MAVLNTDSFISKFKELYPSDGSPTPELVQRVKTLTGPQGTPQSKDLVSAVLSEMRKVGQNPEAKLLEILMPEMAGATNALYFLVAGALVAESILTEANGSEEEKKEEG